MLKTKRGIKSEDKLMIKENIVVYQRGEQKGTPQMKTYDVELHLSEEDKNIGIGMSGGMDSAMLLWLLAYYIDKNGWDITIHQWTCTLDERPFQFHHAKKVIAFIKNYFPSVKFGEHRHKVVNAVEYIDAGTALSWELAIDRKCTAMFNGVTKNPGDREGAYWGKAWIKRNPDRDVDTEWEEERHKLIECVGQSPSQLKKGLCGEFYENLPFIHDDKRIVLALYKKYGLLLDMGPLTRSCEGGWERTEGFSIECKRCWWCIEKQWATAHIWNNDPGYQLKQYPGVFEEGL